MPLFFNGTRYHKLHPAQHPAPWTHEGPQAEYCCLCWRASDAAHRGSAKHGHNHYWYSETLNKWKTPPVQETPPGYENGCGCHYCKEGGQDFCKEGGVCAPVKKLEAVSAFHGMPHPSAPPPPELKSGGDPWAQMVDDNTRGGKDDDYGGYGGYGDKGGKGLEGGNGWQGGGKGGKGLKGGKGKFECCHELAVRVESLEVAVAVLKEKVESMESAAAKQEETPLDTEILDGNDGDSDGD